MNRIHFYIVLFTVGIFSILGAASISQNTRGWCGNAVVTGRGNVTITCTGVDTAELNNLIGLINASIQRTTDFVDKALETLSKKELSTEEIKTIIALRYKTIFTSTEEDAESWGKRLDSLSDKQSQVDALAAEGRKLGEKLSLKWQPVYDFILKLFDDRVVELEKRGLLKSAGSVKPLRKNNADILVVDRTAHLHQWVRDVRFPNGGMIKILIRQGQIHRGKFRHEARLWIEEIVNGVKYMPLNMFFNEKMVYFSLQSETSVRSKGLDYTWGKEPVLNEQFRKELALAIGESLEFIHLNDRAAGK